MAFLSDSFCFGWVFFKVGSQLFIHERFDKPFDFTVAEFCLGLPFELGFRDFYADDGGQPFTNILPL